ncbi:MAG TPA: hypothetical protein VIT91_18630 [Chthoniobacterales bacterium]
MSPADLQTQSNTGRRSERAVPERLRQRVALISLLNGGSIVVFGVVSLVLGALFLDLAGVLVGLAAAVCGGIELRGRTMSLTHHARSGAWLTGSQLGAMLVILTYCGKNLLWPPAWSFSHLSPDAQALLQANPNVDWELLNEMMPELVRLIYLAGILASLIYQGGLFFYYSWAARKLERRPPSVGTEHRKF